MKPATGSLSLADVSTSAGIAATLSNPVYRPTISRSAWWRCRRASCNEWWRRRTLEGVSLYCRERREAGINVHGNGNRCMGRNSRIYTAGDCARSWCRYNKRQVGSRESKKAKVCQCTDAHVPLRDSEIASEARYSGALRSLSEKAASNRVLSLEYDIMTYAGNHQARHGFTACRVPTEPSSWDYTTQYVFDQVTRDWPLSAEAYHGVAMKLIKYGHSDTVLY